MFLPTTGADSPPRFLADAMLGRLAKWLRLLGYDTLYANGLDDAEIARLARAQGRLILTRDTGLARRKGLLSLLIESQDLPLQVAQVVGRFALPPGATFSRCPVCNQLLEEVAKDQIREQVPPYVYATQDHFRRCPVCVRLFWRGTHWQRISEQLSVISDEYTPIPSSLIPRF